MTHQTAMIYDQDDFYDETFTHVDATGANLSGKVFEGCAFEHCTFSDTTLTNTTSVAVKIVVAYTHQAATNPRPSETTFSGLR